MTTADRDLERSLHMRLSFYIREINLERLMFGKELLQIGPHDWSEHSPRRKTKVSRKFRTP